MGTRTGVVDGIATVGTTTSVAVGVDASADADWGVSVVACATWALATTTSSKHPRLIKTLLHERASVACGRPFRIDGAPGNAVSDYDRRRHPWPLHQAQIVPYRNRPQTVNRARARSIRRPALWLRHALDGRRPGTPPQAWVTLYVSCDQILLGGQTSA